VATITEHPGYGQNPCFSYRIISAPTYTHTAPGRESGGTESRDPDFKHIIAIGPSMRQASQDEIAQQNSEKWFYLSPKDEL